MTQVSLSADITARLTELFDSLTLTGSHSEVVYNVLQEAITSRVLPPGQPLGEESIATLFDVSRTPVREAFLRLETEKLARRVPRRGLVVNRVTPQEIVEFYDVREALDGRAAFLAARCAVSTDIASLELANDAFAAAAEAADIDKLLDTNRQFHERLAEASRNSLLLSMIKQMDHLIMRFHNSTFSYPNRAIDAVDEHRQMISAIAERNGDLARRIAESHIAAAREIRIEMLDQEDRRS